MEREPFFINPVLEALTFGKDILRDAHITGFVMRDKEFIFVDIFEHPEDNNYFLYTTTFLPLQIVEYSKRGLNKTGLIDVVTEFQGDYPSIEWSIEKRGIKKEVKQKQTPGPKVFCESIDQDKKGNTYVYFLQSGDGGLIKIGKANDVKKRIAEIQRMSPVPLNVLCMIQCKNAYQLESSIHNRFMRYRRHGEWFEPAKPICDFIKKVKC